MNKDPDLRQSMQQSIKVVSLINKSTRATQELIWICETANVSHLQRQSQHPFEPSEPQHYPSATQRFPKPSTGKRVKLKPSVLDASSSVPPSDYNNYYSAQQPKSKPKPLDYQKQLLNNHDGPAGILKNNNNYSSNGSYSKRRPLIYELKQYEYFNNATRNSNTIQPTSAKNTNSVLQQHYSGQNYNINYNLNFTKNQYNILISPPTTTTTPGLVPGAVPSYDENNHFDSHYQYHHQNNGRNYKNNKISADHHRYNNYNQYLNHQEQQQHHSTKSFYLDEKPPFGVGDITLPMDGGGKMQREEIIIEHSQLVGDGSGPGAVILPPGGPAGQDPRAGQQPLLHGGKGGGKLTAINRSHHFTQVCT
ncbi:GATA zinc finger domain-containing protein 4-like [Topomyia yanbarensis]|uniref:GATA zinc finger domain-containing protein 4-like n=1 Tax=Topomyia yanbarensis TaxID=2498891 RepID=UPI00273A8F47|nr:GATA zinc finger domain-containing protein 4-like [Topomyia yanbarensis]